MERRENKKHYAKGCITLADKIDEIFRKGIIISDNVLHYVDSTFLNPSLAELEKILTDDSNCEKDSLLHLIFSPDESMRIRIEDILESEGFNKEDENKIIDLFISRNPETTVHFTDNRGSLKLAMPSSIAERFISQLNISKKPDKRLVSAINKFVCEKFQTLVKVKLRNTGFEHTENKINFICSFLKRTKSKDNNFQECLDFILDFLDQLQDDSDIFRSLALKKESHFQNLQKAERFEEQVNKKNIETLILQGVRIPHINKEDERKKIAIIDKISYNVFGQISNPEC
ncbi:MAG: hypothetical protein U9Q38_09930 [Thermodesulfobacteriota bacterium]|nr:hypothetical protein [Thermodesulfobacteriota bacterium]